ncbi:MAG: hypothetical protein HC884_07635 [Chloroflexaceae bacterium]|nr:hypothetical protein [Chloroflexaceae bacterium]
MLPEIGRDEPRQVADVGRGNHDGMPPVEQQRGLRCQNDIAIEGGFVGGGQALLSEPGPELGGEQEGLSRDRQMPDTRPEMVNMSYPGESPGPEQFAPDLVISNIGDAHVHARSEQILQPVSTPVRLRVPSRPGH